MSKAKIAKNDCYNCKFIKEKEKKSNRKIPDSGGAYEIDVVFQCKAHPKYNNLESFPFVTEMPCWEGENNEEN
jgi:hypothetical protein